VATTDATPLNGRRSAQTAPQDSDPTETAEWLDSFDAAVAAGGSDRAAYLLGRLVDRAQSCGVSVPGAEPGRDDGGQPRAGGVDGRGHADTHDLMTDYVNTISPSEEPEFPGDEETERRYRRWMRWNAAVMVHRAQAPAVSVGGHISTFASSATLYEVGFNHFFRGRDHPGGGDHVFIQGHASPGIYARAFLEGRLTEAQLDGFRQEKSRQPNGLPSYPHPRLMPTFWEFPTVSMGLGAINAIFQASIDKYLLHRGFKDTSQQHVWAFLGDGEMDEPESRGALHVAAAESLDNLTFVINCNLQRLDGPVRGNGKIIQELEAFFRGAGWNVIKVVWGREWDPLLAADEDRALVELMNSTPDGDYQTYRAENGAYIREHFFGRDPRTKELVQDMTDADIWNLKRGGHDYRKVYAAYAAATASGGRPTVILAKTIKGYGLGSHFAGRNATHQMKKLTLDDLKQFRDSLRIPISDADLERDPYHPPYYHPGTGDPMIRYLRERRRALGGNLPSRQSAHRLLRLPGDDAYTVVQRGSGKQPVATTMAFVRLLRDLMRDKEFGERVVPIIPDEARTFGMDSFFPTAKIYNPRGQQYTSVDRELMLSYKESVDGQILHVGINEAGAVAAFTAVGTSYATHGIPMLPVYIFYSMFGFQRTGDGIWAATDQMARGFLLGATAGRTTLTGEGLQHNDGHSPLLASTNPAVVTYDPAYAYELGHIVRDGLRRMYGPQSEDVVYYLMVYNEPMVQPAEPADLDVEGLLRGMYVVSPADGPSSIQIMASGVAVPWALEAQQLLRADWELQADVWSVTSWTELRRDALAADHDHLSYPAGRRRTPYVTGRLTERLGDLRGAVIAVSDYMRAVPDQIATYVPGDWASLGTDGFGFSDTRPAARRFFKVDGPSIAVRALQVLAARGDLDRDLPARAAARYRLDDVTAGTTGTAGGDA
jgi:pyruvate dehydrogenase E1 component